MDVQIYISVNLIKTHTPAPRAAPFTLQSDMKLKPSPAELYLILKDAVMAFSQDNAPRLAAATAYYAISSIGPLIFLAIAIAGIFLNGKASDPTFVSTMTHKAMSLVQDMLGPSADQSTVEGIQSLVTGLLDGANKQLHRQFNNDFLNSMSLIVGFVTLFMTTTSLFLQFQAALNSMWGVEPKAGIGEMIRSRLVGFLLVIFFSALVIAYVGGNTYLSVLATHLGDNFGMGAVFARIFSGLLAMLFFTPVFAALYKWLPAVKLRWQQVWVGGAVTAVLFVIAQAAIGVYFARATPGSIYGGASTLFIILLWIYFSSMVIFFGAEVTWVYSQHTDEQLLDSSGKAVPQPKSGLRLSSLPPRPLPRGYVPQPVPPTHRPHLTGAFVNAALALLALPTVLVMRLLGLTRFFERPTQTPSDFRFRHYPQRTGRRFKKKAKK